MNDSHLLSQPLASPSTETQPLLSRTYSSANQCSIFKVCFPKLLQTLCQLRYLCLPSKAAILILLWTAAVGAVATTVIVAVVLAVDSTSLYNVESVSLYDSLVYASSAVLLMFYPVSGFIADVCCGRFKMVMIGLFSLLTFLLVVSIIPLLLFLHKIGVLHLDPSNMFYEDLKVKIPFLLSFTGGLVLFIIGMSSYMANYIQLGLDQLLEAPSEYLALFVHWAKWVYNLTSTVVIVTFVSTSCHQLNKDGFALLYSSPFVFAIILSLLLACSYRRRHWFYMERGQVNPYKNVIKVLNFARKHKYPLQRSAFTYCDDVMPSRIDFAKHRFGGPFTTEQVEDVKTFLRIVTVLLSLGPIQVLQVPASPLVFPLFGLHISSVIKHISHDCSSTKILLQSGSLMSMTSVIFFPLYIWILFSLFRNKMPKMFTRLRVGLVLFLLGVFSMFIIDLVGHALHRHNHLATNSSMTAASHDSCMFHFTLDSNQTLHYPTLDMDSSVLILPNVLLGIGKLMFETTTLEFISAQSPHSMKGLLVGVFFAIQGLFQVLGITAIIPLSLTQPWAQSVPPVISCGFVYLLSICTIGSLGFVLLVVAAKRYKYRERDDITFYQRDIEEIYTRYLTPAADATAGINSD